MPNVVLKTLLNKSDNERCIWINAWTCRNSKKENMQRTSIYRSKVVYGSFVIRKFA
jgi:hypothetical protein